MHSFIKMQFFYLEEKDHNFNLHVPDIYLAYFINEYNISGIGIIHECKIRCIGITNECKIRCKECIILA